RAAVPTAPNGASESGGRVVPSGISAPLPPPGRGNRGAAGGGPRAGGAARGGPPAGRPGPGPRRARKTTKGPARGRGPPDREPDPNPPFPKLAALKEQLEATTKERR